MVPGDCMCRNIGVADEGQLSSKAWIKKGRLEALRLIPAMF